MAERSQDGPEQNRQQPEDRASSSGSGGDDDKPNKRNKVGTSNINWEELFVREAANPIYANVSFRVGKDGGTPVPVIPFVLALRAPFFGCLLSKDGLTEEFKSTVEEFLREFEPEIFRIFLYVRFD
jgi:hypothetical protein